MRWLAHRVVVLYLGRIMETGTAEEIFSPPFHPYTQMLLESVPEPDPDRSFLTQTESDSEELDLETETGCPFAPRCPRRIESVCDQEMPPDRRLVIRMGFGVMCQWMSCRLDRSCLASN
ncbi:MAG: oligopeptide/dipeptide ABC transporter ATP-binding protein [Chloroflexota bacterium]